MTIPKITKAVRGERPLWVSALVAVAFLGVTWPVLAAGEAQRGDQTRALLGNNLGDDEPSAAPAEGYREPEERRGEQAPRRPGFRRGPREGRMAPPPGLWRRLNENEREHVQSFVEENFPRMFLELERLKNRSPERYERRMARVAIGMRELMEVMEISPERGELMLQERQLDMEIRYRVTQYRRTKGEGKRARIRRELTQLCNEAFECRHRRREFQIRELEARLQGLHRRHEQQMVMREQLIAQEVRNRLNEPGNFDRRNFDRGNFGANLEPRPRDQRRRRGDRGPNGD